ncbi:tetratricopeptide repeat protein [Streptomyces sp. NPDC048106]|uniref:tetratricopeptide repeat protein n=1 Tax=Streptomyces sp. NPDC048106 TaxID=3155750 RepID=UPI003451C505
MTGFPGDRPEGAAVYNIISGGVQNGPVLQAKYLSVQFTVQLPPQVAPTAPAGLPMPSPVFTGRDADLRHLLRGLGPAAAGSRVTAVSAVAGLAGVGKSQLAVHAAKAALAASWFPGGVLYVNLFGYDPERRLSPDQALDDLLRALGIPEEHLPQGLQNRERLYRTVLAGYAAQDRRILVVADNASSDDQVRPLLPTDGSCAALVTSRHTLDGLDARLYDIDVLPEEASRLLLDEALRNHRGDGDTRITDDPQAAAAIARLCAGLPLALRIAASILASAPRRPAADLAAELQAEHTRLDTLYRGPERAVRAAFDLSYRLLDPGHARLFRLLPLNAGPDLSTVSAAWLADLDPHRTGRMIQDLADAHLVEPAQVWGRWGLHDLVRLYADEHGRAEAATDGRADAGLRLHRHYVTTAAAAARLVPPQDGPASPGFADRASALAWLDQERANLVATAVARPPIGLPDTTVELSTGLSGYLVHRRRFDDQLALAEAARTVLRSRVEELMTRPTMEALLRQIKDRHTEAGLLANTALALGELFLHDEALDARLASIEIFQQLGDLAGEALATTGAGLTLSRLNRREEAADAHQRAAELYRQAGDQSGEAGALTNLGDVLRLTGHPAEALEVHFRAVKLFHEIGDDYRLAIAFDSCGALLQAIGRFGEAVEMHRYTAVTHREHGNREGELVALNLLGSALFHVGRIEEAAESLTKAVDGARELGDVHRAAAALNDLAGVLPHLGRRDEAIELLTEAAAGFARAGDLEREAMAFANLGLALDQAHRPEEAARAHARAAAIRATLGSASAPHAESNG